MVVGQLLGFAAALLVIGPAASVAVLAMTLAGGVLGGFVGARLRPKQPVRDKAIRAYFVEALTATSKKLGEMIIREEFESASSGERDRRAMKAQPQLKLAVTPPAPPKMGGM
jgi:hypothetical protein